MCRYVQQALEALAYAQQHDWGKTAYLTTHNGIERIAGLISYGTDADGNYMRINTQVPATIKALREFGEY